MLYGCIENSKECFGVAFSIHLQDFLGHGVPWHVSNTSRGASEDRQQGWTLNNLAVIQENWTVHLKAKAQVRSHVLTKPCWSHQLGEPQLCEPVLLCRGGTAMLCVPRQAPWHNSTSFSMPAPSYASVRSFLPSPSLIACSWTLATFCCSQCLWYNCLQNCEMSWVKDQQGQPGFWFLLRG